MRDQHSLAGEIRGGRHVLPVRVYYEDTDFSGFVYHASYLRFMERGRTDYLRLLGVDQRALFAQDKDASASFFVVRSMSIDFLRPAAMNDVLSIVTEVEEVRGGSIMLRQRVERDGDTLVSARVRVAYVSGGRAQRIPDHVRAAMAADLASLKQDAH